MNQDVVKEEVRTAGTEKIERQIAELQSKLKPVSGGRPPRSDAAFREDQ